MREREKEDGRARKVKVREWEKWDKKEIERCMIIRDTSCLFLNVPFVFLALTLYRSWSLFLVTMVMAWFLSLPFSISACFLIHSFLCYYGDSSLPCLLFLCVRMNVFVSTPLSEAAVWLHLCMPFYLCLHACTSFCLSFFVFICPVLSACLQRGKSF